MTTRRLTVAAALICLFAILFLLNHWLVIAPNQPSYRAFQKQPTIDPYSDIQYDFLNPSPFEGGLMWIAIWSGTNSHHCYLYDIEHHLLRGQLLRAEADFFNGDHTRVLCHTRSPAALLTREKIITAIEKLTFNKIRFSHSWNDVETFWLLNLKRNSLTKIGELTQIPGGGSSFKPSPDFRYGYNQPSSILGKPEFFVCDLEKRTLLKHSVDGEPIGWWDSQQILIRSSAKNFVLYNIETQKTHAFLDIHDIIKFFIDSDVDISFSKISAFFQWNGKENQFFLTDTHKRWQAVKSFLVKVERPDGKLTLLNPKFKFEWSDHFDPSLKHYVYSGRESGQTNDAVYLRDLATGTNHTLVPTISAKDFSIPAFYKDTIIYIRSNMLWQTDFTGTKTTRLFPPPE